MAKVLIREMYFRIKSQAKSQRLIKSDSKISLDLSVAINKILDRYLDALKVSFVGASDNYESQLKKEFSLGESPLEEIYNDSLESQKDFSEMVGSGFDTGDISTLDFLKNRASRYMDEPILKFKNDIISAIEELKVVRNTANALNDQDITTIPVNKLDNRMRQATKNFMRQWDLGVRTNLAISSSVATHQSMVESYGDDSGDLDVVYMTMEDDRVTDFCHNASFNKDGTYKIYKMSDFEPAGYNLGKKKDEWKLCVPPSHFNCRSWLVYVPKGFKVLAGGILSPV